MSNVYTRISPQHQIDFVAASLEAEGRHRDEADTMARGMQQLADERRYVELTAELLDVSDEFVSGRPHGEAKAAALLDAERTIVDEMDRLRPDMRGRHLWFALKGRKATTCY